jgi:hypothetical protein
MPDVQPAHPSRAVTVAFEFDIDPRWVEQQVLDTGRRPAKRVKIEIALPEVEDPAQRQMLLEAHRFYLQRPEYPMLPELTEDLETVLRVIQSWVLAMQQGNPPARPFDAFEEEKRSWVHTHGSPRLRQAIERDYKANRTYAEERAAKEYPPFWVDTSDDAAWKDRGDPSEEALFVEGQVAHAMVEQGHNYECRIKWLTKPPRDMADWLDETLEAFEGQEAVVIFEYLGRYDLILPVDPEWRKAVEGVEPEEGR